MACVPMLPIMKVYPSGADFAVSSVPTMPAAPGLFSTTTACPHASCSFCAIIRVPMSVPPPGGKGTTMRMGFDGHACAKAMGALVMSAQVSISALIIAVLRSDAVDVQHGGDAVVGQDDLLGPDPQSFGLPYQTVRGPPEKHVLAFRPCVVHVHVEARLHADHAVALINKHD